MNRPASDIDWAKAWDDATAQRGLRANLERQGHSREDFWQKYQSWMSLYVNRDYPGKLLERIIGITRGGESLLDIGAGAGSFAIPLAKQGVKVTAIEPSPRQSGLLMAEIEKELLANIRLVSQPWEELLPEEIGCHDHVMAVYSLEMENIRLALEKMITLAAKNVFIVHTAGNDLRPILKTLFGLQASPDYIYIYNVLYQMGFSPDVEVFYRNYQILLDVQLEMFSYNPGLNPEELAKLKEHLTDSGKTFTEGGQVWLKRQNRDALIWIKKEVQ
ncbi:SAM-dependent methlyltransferase [Dehalococcoides mccartyi]|uniref:SAM-dependent methyltransferase n=1 Tax=Dehalococcoides mccartyi (strain ATCC BAA-2266 / KCTC 15142 / 195) TaxID=243164 RepID=Q3Z6F4_DEHM1|nr:class I SAM-dependent methyltransferase [Dehalococcoides mccartyi]AAW39310.1 conserved hypothetical protein [Dehalococcoides mccartyi 195]AGG08429.1 methyltransferase domain-containing protein [Dehalococcoides mccartyi BTF08]KSV17852.1 SAM-dependent methlyltransferase [Dehalococcoides mccartyi]OBW63385.1 MAG: SAM-dependent methyltransferase [Dehalococcoides mccartyi]